MLEVYNLYNLHLDCWYPLPWNVQMTNTSELDEIHGGSSGGTPKSSKIRPSSCLLKPMEAWGSLMT